MTEYEEIRASIDSYLIEHFKYHVSLVYMAMEISLSSEETVNRLVFAYKKGREPFSSLLTYHYPIGLQKRTYRAWNTLSSTSYRTYHKAWL